MSTNAIEVSNLRKRYGKKEVLRGINLAIPRGSLFGLLGRNGEGKTTTIKALLGLLKYDDGTINVLDMDPRRDAVKIRARVGYMAENQAMYDWMTIREIRRWVASFYPLWNDAFACELQKRFRLEDAAKVGTLSKGQSSKLALMLALGHKPELVILDDPTLGLDPVARKEFLREIIGLLQQWNATVLFSSHLLYEIDPICDHVAILDEGRIVRASATDALRERIKRLIVPVPGAVNAELIRTHPVEDPPGRASDGPAVDSRVDAIDVPGLMHVEIDGNHAAIVTDEWEIARATLAERCGPGIEVEDLNLDEVFEAQVIGIRAAGPFRGGEGPIRTPYGSTGLTGESSVESRGGL